MPGSDRPAALLLSPEAPYPLNGGGALRTASLLHYLSQRYRVDLIAFQHPGQQIVEALPPGLVQTARLIALRPHAHSLRARTSRNAVRLLKGSPPLLDRFSGYDAEITRHLDGRFYDLVVVEHFWLASYLALVRPLARLLVLDLHNVDSVWHTACARASSFPQSWIHRSFARAAARAEKSLLKDCDLLLTTSQEDARRVAPIAPGARICVYPNAIPRRALPFAERPNGNRDVIAPTIAFSGNLEYEPNRTGIAWFCREVWPHLKLRFPKLALLLIGRNAHRIQYAIAGVPGIEYTGPVEDAFTHLARAQICIAPVLSGSGTRLKIIEAWAAGKPVVSTSLGAEGLGAVPEESILIADSPLLFAEAVSRLLLDAHLRQKIAMAGCEVYHSKFTWDVAWNTLSACLQ